MSNEPAPRLNLTFRTAEAAPPDSGLPGGWMLWTGLGIAVGVAISLGSPRLLSGRLSNQLTTANDAGTAYVALEGLDRLEDDSGKEIAKGLGHADAQVAGAAYRLLDARLARWQQEATSGSKAKMALLTQALGRLPKSTPAVGHELAASLASRIHAILVQENDTKYNLTLQTCERIVQRATEQQALQQADDEAPSDAVAIEQVTQLLNDVAPPPPLPRQLAQLDSADPIPGGLPVDTQQFSSQLGNPRSIDNSAPSLSLQSPGAGYVAENARPAPVLRQPVMRQLPYADPQNPSASSTHLIDDGQNHFSLSDSSDLLDEAPRVAQRIGSEPFVRMAVEPEIELGGIQDRPVEELVRLLGSVQPRVSQAAALALRARNWPDEHLELASELATCSEVRRLELVRIIASRSDINPRPWLLWMAADGQLEVRKTSVSLLSSMVDPEVELALRGILGRESDEGVRQSIRQVLLASANQTALR